MSEDRPGSGDAPPEVIVIGGSWGALHPLLEILEVLAPVAAKPPVLVVLHRSAQGAEGMLEELLGRRTGWVPSPVEDKTPIVPGAVYIAPADYHLLVDRTPGATELSLSTESPVRHSRPSIDVLFTAAAEVYGAGTLAIVLSGASDDGAQGAKDIAAHGGRVFVQDPSTAETVVMPQAVISAGVADLVAPADLIGKRTAQLVAGAA